MPPLVECVPNFSEGRDAAVVEALADAVRSTAGAALLDVHTDRWHHRTVLTLVGGPDAVGEAAFRAVEAAVGRIDLTRHAGEHPRVGAADVVPFVPLEGLELGGRRGADMATCVALARRVGRRIGRELSVPVYLYGRAARRPGREVPAAVRRGGFEHLREEMGRDPDLAPDYGPAEVHPTAGATLVGARPPLVAYNVYLATDDVEVARRIARRIRTSDGGLPAVQALGLSVEGRAQVSTNLLDADVTPPLRVFEAVREEARKEGVEVESSEVVGLAPRRALPPGSGERLRLRGPAEGRILEERIVREAAEDGPT